ncbi:MAG: outer membrane lipoprotein carrier protein LolA [Bacteroidota bacterium]|nr:outer membrane lipoprotein carrier protein LolA [Bacteroidota bacterium]
MNDISADFIQSVKLRYKQVSQKTSGTIQMKKGNRYRIVTEEQTIVTDGKKVWMYTPNSKQVLVDIFKQNPKQFSPDKFLTGLPKDFSATNLDTSGSFLILSLKPSKTSSVSSIMTDVTVWVNKESWIVETIEYSDKNGTATSITFSNIRFNKGIADTSFQFQITPDMKVVDVNSFKQ